MNSLDTPKELPKKGMKRYFYWLSELNKKNPIGYQLSDLEIIQLSKKLKGWCK